LCLLISKADLKVRLYVACVEADLQVGLNERLRA